MFPLLSRRTGLLLLLLLGATSAIAQSTLIPVTTRRDMVFDQSGTNLYISTSDGFVHRYNIGSGVIDASYNLGGSLNGVDIAADDSFVLVAQNTPSGSQGVFHRVNLATGAVTNISYTLAGGEAGAWDVVIASNGLALITTQYSGSGSVPLRQVDLSSNAISIRTDLQGGSSVRGSTHVSRSADRSRLYFLEPNISSGPVFSYSAATNTFSARAETATFLTAGAAVNRNGSIVATRFASRTNLDTAPSFNFVRAIGGTHLGVAFDGQADRFYAVVFNTAHVFAYDTGSGNELFRLPVGEPVSEFSAFSTGVLVASPDGRYLAVSTPSGVRLLTVPLQPPAPPEPAFGTPRDLVFDRGGTYLYIGTAEGLVWPYHLANAALGTPYNLGGSLNGIDIAADGSYLVAAQQNPGVAEGAFHRLDLTTGTMTNFTYRRGFSEGGAWDIAVASNGLALGSTDFLGSGPTQLRQIVLGTGVVTSRRSVGQRTQIHRSADNTRLCLLESSSGGPVFTYSAVSDTFGGSTGTGGSNDTASAAVSRNGSLVALRPFFGAMTVFTAPNFGAVQSFAALTSGVAFDAVDDVVYGISPYLSQIIAYDTNTFAERFRFDIGETFSSSATQFGRGLLVASHDGRYLALNTGTAVRVYTVPAVQLLHVASVKSHGGIAHRIDLPLNGPRAVESRSGGATGQHTIVFTFGQNLTSVSGATVTVGTGNVASSSIDSADPRRYIVNLSGITNRQTVKVTLNGVIDVAGNQTALISAQFALLLGDTNGNGTVNASDIGETKAQSGQPLSAANFRLDVNASGAINATDIGIVKSQAGMTLPAAGGASEKQ